MRDRVMQADGVEEETKKENPLSQKYKVLHGDGEIIHAGQTLLKEKKN